jgi:hypothetical protein
VTVFAVLAAGRLDTSLRTCRGTLDTHPNCTASLSLAASKLPVLEESGPVCDNDHPQLAAYVRALDDAATQFNVPIVSQYEYIGSLPDWQSHITSCLYPDAYLLAIKAQREFEVVAPIREKMIGGAR